MHTPIPKINIMICNPIGARGKTNISISKTHQLKPKLTNNPPKLAINTISVIFSFPFHNVLPIILVQMQTTLIPFQIQMVEKLNNINTADNIDNP